MNFFIYRALVLISFLLVPGMAAGEPFKPAGPIEIIVMAGQGGGADKAARRLQKIIEDEKLVSQPISVVNEPGGYGALAFQRLLGAPDPDHALMVTLNSFFTTPLLQPGLDVDILTFQPIARLGEEQFYLWVRADRPIETLEAFAARAGAKGREWLMAGTGVGGADEILTEYLNTVFGLDMSYRALHSGGESAAALLHGRVDSTLNNPSEVLAMPEPQRLRPLVGFGKERLPSLADAPTFEEQGQPFAYTMHRAVVGGPAMSAEAAAFYAGVFQAASEHKDWRDYRERNGLSGAFLTGEALRDYWREEREHHKSMLQAIWLLP